MSRCCFYVFPSAPSVTWLRSKWFTLKKAVPNYTECDHEGETLYHDQIMSL